MFEKFYEWNKGNLELIITDENLINFTKEPKGKKLFSYKTQNNSIWIDKCINKEGLYFHDSIVKSKLDVWENIKFQKIDNLHDEFMNYILYLLSQNNIIGQRNHFNGINLGSYGNLAVKSDSISFSGNYYDFSQYFDDKKVSDLIKKELSFIGKTMGIIFNMFEEIYNPNLIFNKEYFAYEIIKKNSPIFDSDAELFKDVERSNDRNKFDYLATKLIREMRINSY